MCNGLCAQIFNIMALFLDISRWTAGSRAGTVSSDFTPCWQISGWTASRVTVYHSLSFDNFDSYKSLTLLFHQAVLASRHGRCCQGFTEPFQPNLECHGSGWQRQSQATGTLNHADRHVSAKCIDRWIAGRMRTFETGLAWVLSHRWDCCRCAEPSSWLHIWWNQRMLK